MINLKSKKVYIGSGLVLIGIVLGTVFTMHQNTATNADICIVGVDCPGSNPQPAQPEPTSVVQEQVNNQGSNGSPIQTLPTPTQAPVVNQTVQPTPEAFKSPSPCN